jgi:glycosyltransferase involved in cell wall biosynthesis
LTAVKTIWYCHHYAGSPNRGMSYRPYYMAQAFCNAAHRAFVISASFHHLQQQSTRQTNAVELTNVDGVPYIFLKTRAYRGQLGRLLNMLQYAGQFLLRAKNIIAFTGKPDVIIVSTTHPFHYPVLERLAKKYRAQLIFEIRDLWPLSWIEILHWRPWHPLVLSLGWIEKRALRHADHVVSLLDKALPYLQSKGLAPDKFHIISNGVDTRQIAMELPEKMQQTLLALKQTKGFLLGYAGALGPPNAMNYAIEAMALLEQQGLPIHFVIIGEGALKAALQAQVQALGLKQVTFFSAIPKTHIPSFLTMMDALYLGWNDVSLYQYGVSPNKFFDYMLSSRPILESGGSPEGIIDRFQCGLRCQAGNPTAIAAMIQQLFYLPESSRLAMGKAGRDAVEAYFDYQYLAGLYLNLF